MDFEWKPMSVVSVSIDGSSGLGGMLCPVLMEAVGRRHSLNTYVVTAMFALSVAQSTGSG